MGDEKRKSFPLNSVLKVIAKDAGFAFVDRNEAIQQRKCTQCGKDCGQFRDQLSVKEYLITGWCQECQNAYFDEPEPEYDPEDQHVSAVDFSDDSGEPNET